MFTNGIWYVGNICFLGINVIQHLLSQRHQIHQNWLKKLIKGIQQNLSCFDRINVTTIIYCINNVLSFCLKNGTLIHLISPLRQDYDTRSFLMWSAHTLTSKDKNYLLPLSWWHQYYTDPTFLNALMKVLSQGLNPRNCMPSPI